MKRSCCLPAPDPAPFMFHFRDDDEGCCLVLHGELDADTALDLERGLARAGSGVNTIDARGLSFVAAAGLNVLVTLSEQDRIELVASRQLARLIEICGAGDRFVVVEGPDGGSPSST